jgi:hypothetical protein
MLKEFEDQWPRLTGVHRENIFRRLGFHFSVCKPDVI